MLARLLTWLLLPLALWLAWRWASARRRGHQKHTSAERLSGELLVACAHCGLRLPKTEAIQAQGHYYCGPRHRDAAQACGGRRPG